MKTILVTGGTGFLGNHLVEQLKRQEPDSRLRLLCRRESVGDRNPQTEVVRGDITSPQDVSAAAQGVEEIYHLAGPVEREPRDPTRLYRTHIEGVRNVCEAVREHEVKKAVLVSSSGTVAVSREPRQTQRRFGIHQRDHQPLALLCRQDIRRETGLSLCRARAVARRRRKPESAVRSGR